MTPKNIMVVEAFLRSLVQKCGKHAVYSDRGSWYPEEACRTLGLQHRLLHSTHWKNLSVERV
ncbi:MAG TPA: hypothetical protein VF172_12705 [Nitrososphaera sp.]